MKLDYKKIQKYNEMFQSWKKFLFPNEEYKYLNEFCGSFRDLISAKAMLEGFEPYTILCTDSIPSKKFMDEYPGFDFEKDGCPVYTEVTKERDNKQHIHSWCSYHMATIIKLPIYEDPSKEENIVFDPVLYNSIVAEKEWRKNINADNNITIKPYKEILSWEYELYKDKISEKEVFKLRIIESLKEIEKVNKEEPIVLKESQLVEWANKESIKINIKPTKKSIYR